MNTPPSRRSIFYSQLFSGIGIGLLLGIIIGLSVSPVVKTILGALAGLLAAFLGLQESLFSKQEESSEKVANRIYLNGIRAGAFGIATVIALLIGMYMRTHGVLSITIEKQVKNWTDAGVDSSLAQELVIYEKFKLFKKDGALNVDTAQAKLAAEKNNAGDGFLFTKEEMQSFCVSLNIENMWGDSVQNALDGYGSLGTEIANYAKELEKITEEGSQRDIMNSVKELVCFLGNGTDESYDKFCEDMGKLDYNGISFSLEKLSSSAPNMEMAMVAATILQNVESEPDRASLTRAILTMICSD